jgi:hypothetical protein
MDSNKLAKKQVLQVIILPYPAAVEMILLIQGYK